MVKGDEKLANVIAGLINTMKDLNAFALEHKIEGQV